AWWRRLAVGLPVRSPGNGMKIEADLPGRLYHPEIRRLTEVPRHRAGVVALPVFDLVVRAPLELWARRDRALDRLECRGNQGGTDGARRFAAAQRDQLTPVTWRNRRILDQVAHQVEDVLEIVAMPQPFFDEIQTPSALIIVEPHRAADPQVVPGVFA